MKKIISIGILMFILMSMCTASAEFGSEQIIGNPEDSLADILPQIKWLTGSAMGGFIVAGVLGILVGGIVYFYGSMINRSDSQGRGITGIIGSIGVALLVTIGITLFFAVINKF